MRRIVLQMSVSVDGFVAGPQGGLGGSLPEDDDQTRWKLDQLHQTGTHIMGRVTYEQMATHWPTATDEYAAPMNEIPKVVFSKTLERADWNNSRVARGDTAEQIARLKREPGKDIVAHGGAAFVQALSNLGLIDEYRLVIEPVALGNGLPMFKDLPAVLRLNLVEAKTFSTGQRLTSTNLYEAPRPRSSWRFARRASVSPCCLTARSGRHAALRRAGRWMLLRGNSQSTAQLAEQEFGCDCPRPMVLAKFRVHAGARPNAEREVHPR